MGRGGFLSQLAVTSFFAVPSRRPPSLNLSGTEKVPQRTFETNILPNFRVNFLVRFASKPLFYWECPRIVQKILWYCSCVVLALGFFP